MAIFIGTAGWTIPRQVADQFPSQGSSLQRYADRFSATEINSSFHRSHRADTWARWRDSVPDGFRFAVKMPKQITHLKRLVDCSGDLDRFIQEAQILGAKLAVLLVQLPPTLAFDAAIAARFFSELRARSHVAIACEPRNVSWFGQEASDVLYRHGVARVAADPAICAAASTPGGWGGLIYWRLHGSPVTYRSSYRDRLGTLSRDLRSEATGENAIWCIFDNTASSAATADALLLVAMLNNESRAR